MSYNLNNMLLILPPYQAASFFHKIITSRMPYSQHPYVLSTIIQLFSGKEGLMMKKIEPSSAFCIAVENAVLALTARDFQLSREIIARAMTMDMDAPEPHNLLGILYELLGDDGAARQHYRAAYALDPTYKPSCRNLERLVLYGFNATGGFDYGVPIAREQDEDTN